MKFNESDMWSLVKTNKCQLEGRLQHRPPGSSSSFNSSGEIFLKKVQILLNFESG